jgi:Fe2+ transport system protein FeoA
MSVSDLEPGTSARITRVDALGATRQRLLDLGLIPNTLIRVARVAWSGSPIWVQLRGTQIALRRSEAQTLGMTRA